MTHSLQTAVATLAIALVVVFGVAHITSGALLNEPVLGGEMLGAYSSDYDVVEVSTGTTSVSTLPVTLGSIIVADSSSVAGNLYIYATSSHSVATSSNDLLMTFDTQAGEGTYTFDVAVGEGILIDVDSGNDGDIQVTYRR